MLKIGLTGGIASGKSTVAEIFASLGAALVDTDVVAREVVRHGSPALAAIRRHFGADFITADGELDRRKMRQAVFADPDRRKELEAILHPLIRERTLAAVARVEAPYVVIAVPLLVETRFDELVDRVLVVDCPQALQLGRLMQRDDVDAEQARATLEAQVDRDARLRVADDVIDNGGNLDSTRQQVEALHARYLELGRDCSGQRGRAE